MEGRREEFDRPPLVYKSTDAPEPRAENLGQQTQIKSRQFLHILQNRWYEITFCFSAQQLRYGGMGTMFLKIENFLCLEDFLKSTEIFKLIEKFAKLGKKYSKTGMNHPKEQHRKY